MTQATLSPVAVATGYQPAVTYLVSSPTGLARTPARTGGSTDLGVQTDGSDATYHTLRAGFDSLSDPNQYLMDVLSWDFVFDPALGTPPTACALKMRWRSALLGEQATPVNARTWFLVVTEVATGALVQSNGSFGSTQVIGQHLRGWDQADIIDTIHFWDPVDLANPTDSGNWLEDGVDGDISALSTTGLRFSVFMDSSDPADPAWVDIFEGALVVEYVAAVSSISGEPVRTASTFHAV